jgi:RNA polymerase sigma factor (sigma-70 family)
MKDETKFGFTGVGTLSLRVGEGSLRPERTSCHDLARLRTRAIARTAPLSEAVTPPDDQPGPPDDLESTRTLLELTRCGDDGAKDRLVSRFLPALQACARGRMPRKLRRLTDTDDLVQMTFISALKQVDQIEYLHEGGFFAYLRTVLRNKIVDLLRAAKPSPEDENILEGVEDPGPSPFDQAVGAETFNAYEVALETLTEKQRAAVMLRIEMGLTFKEVADAVGCPSANAARMLVARALVRLSEVMNDPR